VSREAAAANLELLPLVRGKHNSWANAQGYVLSSLREFLRHTNTDDTEANRKVVITVRTRGGREFIVDGNCVTLVPAYLDWSSINLQPIGDS
jgi:hypothetical protein